MAINFLRLLKKKISNNININIGVNSLFNNFGDNSIIFFFFLNLRNSNRLNTKSIYYILNLFFFKHGLNKFGLLNLIFKTLKLFFYIFIIIAFDSYYDSSKS